MSLWENDKNKSRGAGRAATEASLTRVGRLKGQRYLVGGSPVAAIDVAIGQLLAEGFVLRTDDLDHALRQQGSNWVGRTVEIGDVSNAKRLWWQNFLFTDSSQGCSILWEWAMRRGIAPTLVAVVARPAVDGQSELVISPVQSGVGPFEDRHAAEPRLRRVLAAVGARFAQTGQLIQQPEEVEPLLLDEQCPAQEKALKSLINWPADS